MISMVKKLLTACIGLAMLSMTSLAQEAEPAVMGKAAERVEQFKKIRMMEVLGMDEQTSIRFFARYDKNLTLMRDLRQKQLKALAQVQSMRKNNAPDNDFAKVVADLRSLEDQVNQSKSQYIDDLKNILTNKQLAEYLVFELRFQQNLRDLVRDLQRNRQEPANR